MDNIWVVIGLLFGIIVFKAIAMSTTLAIGGVGGSLFLLWLWESLEMLLPKLLII